MIQKYWATLSGNRFNQPNFTDLMRITESIFATHWKNKHLNKDYEAKRARLEYMNSNVDADLNVSIATMEVTVFKNWNKPPDSEIIINDQPFKLAVLFDKMNRILKEMTEIVTDIAMNYSLDIPMGNDAFGSEGEDEHQTLKKKK